MENVVFFALNMVLVFVCSRAVRYDNQFAPAEKSFKLIGLIGALCYPVYEVFDPEVNLMFFLGKDLFILLIWLLIGSGVVMYVMWIYDYAYDQWAQEYYDMNVNAKRASR